MNWHNTFIIFGFCQTAVIGTLFFKVNKNFGEVLVLGQVAEMRFGDELRFNKKFQIGSLFLNFVKFSSKLNNLPKIFKKRSRVSH